MLYEEFLQGTGCKANEHNYQVYRHLEVIYMYGKDWLHEDITKEFIYEYGKKLVDNSPSPEELKRIADLKEQIASIKSEIKDNNESIKYAKERRSLWEKWERSYHECTGDIEYYTHQNKELRTKLTELQWLLQN